MLDEMEHINRLRQQGFFCSQMILIEGLMMLGKQDSDVVRVMHPLANGIGGSGEICGALTGAACLLGLYAGKGAPEEENDERLDPMVMELVGWFKEENIPRYGDIRCAEILQGNPANRSARCPGLVMASLQKAKELLVENGFDLSGVEG
jgi:C_GCAxxG_C_C family probable redox protein